MYLAHSVATNVAREVRRERRQRGMLKALADRGYDKSCVTDVTPYVLGPISAESLARYERETGIAVPWR